MANEFLVTLYLYGYIVLSDFTYGYNFVQDDAGYVMLGIMLGSIAINFGFLIANVVAIVRKSFLRWYYKLRH